MGLFNKVRRGYQNIRVKFRVKTDAENIRKLKGLSTLSPVFDTVSHGANVEVEVERM